MGNAEAENESSGEVLLFSAGFLRTIFWLFIAVVLSRLLMGQFFFVDGQSMEQTFHDKELLVAEKLTYYFSEPQRYQMVIFHPPYDPSETLMKRILGLPGEEVRINDGSIFVFNDAYPQGLRLGEPYRQNAFTNTENGFDKRLGPDEYLVVGDNNPHSFDGRSFGPISRKAILGRIFLRIFPLSDIGVF